jgi:cytochrome c peroxidase
MLFRIAASSVFIFLFSCGPAPKSETPAPAGDARPVGQMIEIAVPLGLPPLSLPADNPPTKDAIELGRRLYYDPGLSKDNTVSCAFCHSPKAGFSDGQKTSVGVGGKRGGRNAPTVWNSAYNSEQFWDGRSPSLEDQAGGPILNPIEMANTEEAVVRKLNDNSSYAAEFEKAFGKGPVTFQKIRFAIASFERTVLSGDSPFDRYQYRSEKRAMSGAAIRGLEVFKDAKKGNCAVCHTIEEKHALFTDNKYHNLGVGMDKKGELTDLGRYEVTKREEDRGAFKTPTLRNIARSAPYMHDGSLKTLKEVVDFYVGGGNANKNLDKEIKPLEHLSKQERADLVAFMEALTGVDPEGIGPIQ